MIPHNEHQDPLEPDVRRIVRAAGSESMSTEDKSALWQRIEGDMREPVRRNTWWKVAAAVILLAASGWWVMQQRSSPKPKSILAFAQQQQHIADTSTETKLLLGNNKTVTFKNTNTSLAYNNNQVQADGQYYNQDAAAFNTLIIPYGRQAHITLGDGTEVWLNAGSRIVYPVAFNSEEREVFLEGEAYFNVSQQQNKPFFVYTKGLKTTVLGTSFNVSAYADDAEQSVVLISGSVKVSVDNAEQQLVPGQKAAYAGSNITKSNVNTQLYTAWKDGHLILEHEPLPQILKKLSRYFNIRITSSTALTSTFSGDLDLSENIDYVMQSLGIGTGLVYEKTTEGIILKKP